MSTDEKSWHELGIPDWLLNTTPNSDHPAKFNDDILSVIVQMCHEFNLKVVWDPFGGIGGIHKLPPAFQTYASEIEPEWAAESARWGHSTVADFFEIETWHDLREMPFWFGDRSHAIGTSGVVPDAIITSPTYGNRMADKHTQSKADTSKRLTYRHRLGRKLSDNNSGGLQWGDAYRDFHQRAWNHAYKLLSPGAFLIINVKDHYRNGALQMVSRWHEQMCRDIGFHHVSTVKVPVKGMGFGANQQTHKVRYENVFAFQKEATP